MPRSPSRRRASSREPNQGQFVPSPKPTFVQHDPLDRSPFPFAIVATTPYASHLLGKCTTNDRNVLHAVIEEWNHKNRHINTSIKNIHLRLIASHNSIKENKISDHLTNLVNNGLIIKDHSRPNDLRLRVNPIVYWKGNFHDSNRVQENERGEWPADIEQHE